MGTVPLLQARFYPMTRLIKFLGGVTVLSLLISCISDGANQTGGQYLAKNGVVLQNPLYHIIIPEFPVDSLWTQSREGSHLGTPVLMAGVAGAFSAQARIAFSITDSNTLSNVTDSNAPVRLSLRAYQSAIGIQTLKSSVGDSGTNAAISVRDSLSFLVESWAFQNLASNKNVLTDAQFTDTLSRKNRRFLFRMDTVSVLDSVNAKDTIVLAVKNAYTKDSLQAPALPNLKAILKAAGKSTKWLIQLQLTPLPKIGDTGAGMLRFENRVGTGYRPPSLLFGNATSITTAAATQYVQPILHTSVDYFANYFLRYSGTVPALLPGKGLDLHLMLNRNRLMDSIGATLQKKLGIAPTPGNINGNFDLTYFVPYAQMSMPLSDSMTLEGNHPIETKVTSELDSLLPNANAAINGHFPVILVPLNSTSPLFVTTDPSNDNAVLDTISISYETPTLNNAALKKVILKYAKDTLQNDTTYISVGQRVENKKILSSSRTKPLFLVFEAGSEALSVTSYFSSNAKDEVDNFRDPATGVLLTTLADKLQRLIKPKQDSLTLWVTRGLQVLLNRADIGKNVFSDLVVQAVSAVDTSVVTTSTASGYGPDRLPFPVLSVIPPKLKNKKLTVRLDLYLYPLKKER